MPRFTWSKASENTFLVGVNPFQSPDVFTNLWRGPAGVVTMLRDSKSTMRRNSGSVGVSLGVAASALGDCSEETSSVGRLERTFPEAVEDAQRACQTLFSSNIHDRAEESEVCGALSQERQRRCRTSAPPLLAVVPILQLNLGMQDTPIRKFTCLHNILAPSPEPPVVMQLKSTGGSREPTLLCNH